MADNAKRLETELLHHLDLILRHGPFRVGHVLRVPRQFATVPVAPQVCSHYRKILRQTWGNLVPHGMGLRIAVEQQ